VQDATIIKLLSKIDTKTHVAVGEKTVRGRGGEYARMIFQKRSSQNSPPFSQNFSVIS